MAEAAPVWRRLFDMTERLVGEPLESAAKTPEFAELLAITVRLQRKLERNRDVMTTWLVHQWGLPARSDVAEVARGVARVERRLQKLSHELEELEDARRREAEQRAREKSEPAERKPPSRERKPRKPSTPGEQSS